MRRTASAAPGDEPDVGEAPAERRQDEEVGRARQQDAHAGVARQDQRTVRVEQAADGAGLGAQRPARAERGRDDVRQDDRGVQEHDREILGQVAEVLDLPSRGGSSAAGRTPPRARTGAGSRDGAGGRSSRGCRRRERPSGIPAPSAADQPRRSHEPPPPTKRKNGAANDDRQPGRAGKPEQEAGEELAAVRDEPAEAASPAPLDRSRPARRRPSGSPPVPVRELVVAERRAPGPRRGRRRSRGRPARPPGRGPGTTSSRAGRRTRRPSRSRRRRSPPTRTQRPDRQVAERPPGEPDVDRAEDREDQLAVGGEAPQRDERQQDDGRQRREGNQAARRCRRSVATGRTSWKKALPGDAAVASTG